jgi:hypothetical protein
MSEFNSSERDSSGTTERRRAPLVRRREGDGANSPTRAGASAPLVRVSTKRSGSPPKMVYL